MHSIHDVHSTGTYRFILTEVTDSNPEGVGQKQMMESRTEFHLGTMMFQKRSSQIVANCQRCYDKNI